MAKLNLWMKRYSVPFLWASGILIALAAAGTRILQLNVAGSLCYLLAFVLSGLPILVRAIQALRYKTVSIELLVSIASMGACVIGEFHESAIVTFLFQLGSFLEQKTMKKTRSAIKALTELAPSTAWRIVNTGEEGSFETEQIDADEVEVGDLLLVKSGNQIASDGIVVKGEGYALEAGITGEPLAKHKQEGDSVYAGTILDSGTLQLRATKVGEDTTFARIIALVEEAQDAKSPVERLIDRFAKYYTPSVIVIAAAVFALTRNVDTAITVLVLACPGALVIGAPIANVAGIGCGAREGILLKGGESIYTFARTDTVLFDKTGTVTAGIPKVSMQRSYTDNPEEALAFMAAAERMSDHPLAQAVLLYADGLPAYEAEEAKTEKGLGMAARVCGHPVLVGSRRLLEQKGILLNPEILTDLQQLQEQGASTVLVAVDGVPALLLGIQDPLKADAVDSIRQLKSLGIRRSLMLTGDNSRTAAAIAEKLGITEFCAELLPEDKLTFVRRLQQEGRIVTFVGDGINDSPALAAADTGIAMGSGTDVAIDNSDVVLLRSDLASLVKSLRLAKKTVAVLYENIAIAVGTVLLLLAGLFAGYIHMSVGMLIHEASILIVIFNAMRLRVSDRSRKEAEE